MKTSAYARDLVGPTMAPYRQGARWPVIRAKLARQLRCAALAWLLLVLLGSMCLQPPPGLAEPVVIKFATLAPEGTPWMNTMEDMNRELQEKALVSSPSASMLVAWRAMNTTCSAKFAAINCRVARLAVSA